MKKYQYIIAAVCIMLGAAGFAGIYAMNHSQKNEIAQEQENKDLENTQLNQVGLNHDTENTEDTSENGQIANNQEPIDDEKTSEVADNEQNVADNTQTPVTKPQEEVLHFAPEKGLTWPVKGATLLDYSMDATIYFPTLNQYQYHPAMVIAADVNSKVYIVAKGKITNIETNEVTGCTVTQDLGDGYTAIYGQLKELNVDVGDMVESGLVVGYVFEPTKYYAVEGSNVYFQLLKDGKPLDPATILP